MNKQTITTILLALVTMTGQAQSQQQEEQNQDTTINWKLEGAVDNAEPTDTLFIIDMEEQRDIASLQVKDGKIVATGGTLDEPAACGIMTKDRRRWITAFVLENGTINIHVDMKKNYLQHVGGTPIILFAPDGTILARGLHGEAIEKKLAELFEPFDEEISK